MKPPLVIGYDVTPMRIKTDNADEMFVGLSFTTVLRIGGPQTKTPEVVLSLEDIASLAQRLQQAAIRASQIHAAEIAPPPTKKQ